MQLQNCSVSWLKGDNLMPPSFDKECIENIKSNLVSFIYLNISHTALDNQKQCIGYTSSNHRFSLYDMWSVN